jgi:glycerophosphoryl diester phosphodiesterase
VILIHHAAHRGYHGFPPGSLSGLRYCLEAGARVVELDITPLAHGDFALLHDEQLEEETDGQGPVVELDAAQVTRLHYRLGGIVTDEAVGLLSQAVALAAKYPHLWELQLDLKPYAPLTDTVLGELIRLVSPLRERVRVSSPADWALRRLHALAPELNLGFDPMFYLDLERSPDDREVAPPFRLSAYGYLDDHPLATRVWGSPADYLAARAEALWVQAPFPLWYIRGVLLARALDDGFDWIAWLRERGAGVAAWTLDPDQPHHVALAQRLAALGVERITTNDPPGLAAALGDEVTF